MIDYPTFHGRQACLNPTEEQARGFAGALGADPGPAQAVCAGCPFTEPCREWALTHDTTGVWGASTDTDRIRIRAARGLPTPPAIGDQLDELILASRARRRLRRAS